MLHKLAESRLISSRLSDALNHIYTLESSSRFKSFEGLRAFAIILVFNVHFFGGFVNKHYFVQENSFAESMFEVLHSGYLGVDLFFVLSGFLIFSTLYRNKPTLLAYISHRMLRILPAHVVVLIILISLSNNEVNIAELCSNMFFLPAFFQNIPNYNFVTWTLGWEWLFYLLMFGLFYAGNAFYLYAGMVISLLLMFSGTFPLNSLVG